MLTLRTHKERLLTGSQPVSGFLCARSGRQDWSTPVGGSQGYAPAVGTGLQPAIAFPMNPEVGL